MEKLEKTIGYTFTNKEYLFTALTHSSYYNENRNLRPCNERLEFVGDAILSAVSAEYLYNNDSGDEGELSRIRAMLVREEALYEYASEINLGRYLFLGKGETAGRSRSSTLADAFEALIAAIYLDGGFEESKKFVLPFIDGHFDKIRNIKDYKTMLQEIVQKSKEETLSYSIIEEMGPAHDKIFVCRVCINSNNIAQGSGKSKKNAEQEAAKEALRLMGVIK